MNLSDSTRFFHGDLLIENWYSLLPLISSHPPPLFTSLQCHIQTLSKINSSPLLHSQRTTITNSFLTSPFSPSQFRSVPTIPLSPFTQTFDPSIHSFPLLFYPRPPTPTLISLSLPYPPLSIPSHHPNHIQPSNKPYPNSNSNSISIPSSKQI